MAILGRGFALPSLFLTLVVFATDIPMEPGIDVQSDVAGSSALKMEVEQLQSMIHALESHIDEKTQELKMKDNIIAQKEKVIQDKSDVIISMRSELSSLQEKRIIDTAEQVGRAHARVGEMEKKIYMLEKELESRSMEKEALGGQASEAIDKVNDLNMKIDSLNKINDGHKSKVRKMERALKVAEEEVMKAKLEIATRTKELLEVNVAWLPPWLTPHVVYYQSLCCAHWEAHGKPLLEWVIRKMLEKKSEAEKWAEPHLQTIQTRLVSPMEDKCREMIVVMVPYLQLLTARMVDAFEASWEALVPHIFKAQQLIQPYLKEIKESSKPYVDHVANVMRPHVHRMKAALRPYKRQLLGVSVKFVESVMRRHRQLQYTVKRTLKRRELTTPLATEEFVWFLASAWLVLPILLLLSIFSAIFCKKSTKATLNAKINTAPRRAKRGYPEK